MLYFQTETPDVVPNGEDRFFQNAQQNVQSHDLIIVNCELK